MCYHSFKYLAFAATISDTHIEYRSESQRDILEVGIGNLKLIYSGKEGKLTQYINSRSKVYMIGPHITIYLVSAAKDVY